MEKEVVHVTAQIVLRIVDDALISKVCTSYLREIIDADAEVRSACGEHGQIHQFWSGVMEGPTAAELGQMLKRGRRDDAVMDLLTRYLAELGYTASAEVAGFGKLYVPRTLTLYAGVTQRRNSPRATRYRRALSQCGFPTWCKCALSLLPMFRPSLPARLGSTT